MARGFSDPLGEDDEAIVRIQRALAEVYTPEGVDIWLAAEHKEWGGWTVSEMLPVAVTTMSSGMRVRLMGRWMTLAMSLRERIGNGLARRWLRRLDRTLDNTPSWRLLQELKLRGDLLEAEEIDGGLTRGGTGKLKIGARPCDRYGLPLWRIKIEED